MFLIGFDFGIKNIGVAIGQNYTKTANVLKSIRVIKGIPDWKLISTLLLEWKPSVIIVGNPLNMNGTKQKITRKVENFVCSIKSKFNIPVYLHDERLSTVEAKSLLFKKNGYKSLTKNNIDSLSAVIILESWLSNF